MDQESSPREAGGSSDKEGRPPLQRVLDTARAEARRLQSGPAVRLGDGEIPVAILVALLIFVVAFLGAWMILWAALGGIGLGLGWIPATVAGAGAIRLYRPRG